MPRTRASSRSHNTVSRRTPLKEVLEGHILWLPKKEDIRPRKLVADLKFDDGCYNHPVVILSTDELNRTATVLLV
jgi:hypothetical protein